MPVILPAEAWPAWLGEEPATPEELKALLKPYPTERMRAFSISTRVNSVRNDDADRNRGAGRDRARLPHPEHVGRRRAGARFPDDAKARAGRALAGSQREAVHRRVVKPGQVSRGSQRFSEHPTQRLRELDTLGCECHHAREHERARFVELNRLLGHALTLVAHARLIQQSTRLSAAAGKAARPWSPAQRLLEPNPR